MQMTKRRGLILIGLVAALLFEAPPSAFATVNSQGLLDNVAQAFVTAASSWASVIQRAALYLFGMFTAISMVWSFGFLALRRAEIGEFLAEFVKFTINTGFFLWLLTNGTTLAGAIFKSMQLLSDQASGQLQPTPSGLMDIGFALLNNVVREASIWSVTTGIITLAVGVITVIILAMMSVNYIILIVEAYILAYAGSFLLGFGGLHWTREIAINYFKTCLGLGMQILTMSLIMHICVAFLTTLSNNLGATNIQQSVTMLVTSVVFLLIADRVPSRVAGIISGHSISQASAGVGGMAMAAAGAAVAVGTIGAASAVKAAINQGSQNVASGSDVLGRVAGRLSGGGGNDGGRGGGGALPFGEPGGSGSGSMEPPAFARIGESSDGGGSPVPGLRVARVAADAGANLMKNMGSAFGRSVDQTAGGRVAAAIKASGEAARARQLLPDDPVSASFSGNSIAAAAASETEADQEGEVSAFVGVGGRL
jgi:P-type conjugative transfer protein TrbL